MRTIGILALAALALVGVPACVAGWECDGCGDCCTWVCAGFWCWDDCDPYCDSYYLTLDEEPPPVPDAEVW